MAWTEEQNEAIHRRGESIIVSAGAGSGKTAVLSERILDYCLNGGDIRRVLVLTFTEAAASEMKERIRKKLKDNGLLLQAEYIDSTYITTFDSYSLSMVKKYYYKLGLEKGISIMDGSLIEIKTSEIIRELFTEYYISENNSFLSFLKKYSLQDDKEVLRMVMDMCKRLELIVDLDSFIKNYEDNYFSSEKLNQILSSYKEYVNEEVSDLISSLEDLKNEALYDPASEVLSDLLSQYLSHLDVNDTYSDLYQQIVPFELPRVSTKADLRVKELKKQVSDKLSLIKKNVFMNYETLESMRDEILSTKDDVLFLLQMSNTVLERLFEYKKELNMFGFMDIAKLAISLVRDDLEVREELKNSYDEILVDEYQDTSDIQEAFLSYIENNNRYMVGDIKQAIYRFRNANPYIFKEKYNNFAIGNGGYKIDLTFNFRSRREVLDNINLLFNFLMSDTLGDADYKKDHQMRYGQKDYLKVDQNVNFNLDILSYEKPEDMKFSQAEIEAFIIGKDIKDKMLSEVLALHKNGFSKVSFNDFAILISTASEFLTFKSIFEYLNIPMSIEASLDLKASILPTLYKNILVCMNGIKESNFDKEYYHSLASLARSFLYEYSDQDIYEMVKLNKKYPIIDDLRKLTITDEISYSQLFYDINSIIHVYDKLEKIGDVDSSLVVLEYIHNIFKQFDTLAFSINEAKDYMCCLLDSGIKMEYKPTSSAKDAVRIMTIHKSKGLEFPYVYFPLLTKGFNQADMRATVGLSKKYGIFIPFVDEGKSSTIIRTLYSKEVREEDISEKVRLLYVALTRAREKMILLLPKEEEKDINPKKIKSFSDMIYYANSLSSYFKMVDLNDYNIVDYKTSLKEKGKFLGSEVIQYEQLEKYEEINKAHISKELLKLPSEEEKKALELGIRFHQALEALDFNKMDIDNLPVDDFLKNRIRKIFSNELFKNIKKSRGYHELEFLYDKDGMSYHGIIDLLLEYDDHFDLIDYKLNNTDSIEYRRQLSIYKEYISQRSDKRIDCYLVSILKNEVNKIDI